MKVIFIHTGSNEPNRLCEKFSEKVINLVHTIYVLPDKVEIQFENLGPNIYGMTMLDPRFPNRIRLNQDLALEEIIIPLTHELIHLHQMYTNRLRHGTGGKIFWDKTIYKVDMLKMSYNEYQQLPWERDVIEKQEKLLKFLQQNNKKLKIH